MDWERRYMEFCFATLRRGADAGYFALFINESLRLADEREKRIASLTGKALEEHQRHLQRQAIHAAIHERRVKPTASGVAKHFGITRGVAYDALDALVASGVLKASDEDEQRARRYVSRAMP